MCQILDKDKVEDKTDVEMKWKELPFYIVHLPTGKDKTRTSHKK